MGPRPFGRGDGTYVSPLFCLPSFNGAAAFRPRRHSCEIRCRANDEASMGPRPFGRGDTHASSFCQFLIVLQWGRGLSAAETAGLASCVVITTYARVCEREGYVRQVFGHIRNPAVHKSLLVKDLPSRERAQDPPPPPSRSRGYSPENMAKTPRPQWRPAPNAMGPAASSLKTSLAQRSGHLRR